MQVLPGPTRGGSLYHLALVRGPLAIGGEPVTGPREAYPNWGEILADFYPNFVTGSQKIPPKKSHQTDDGLNLA